MSWKEPKAYDPVWVEDRLYNGWMPTGFIATVESPHIYVQFFHGYSKWEIKGSDRQTYTYNQFFGHWSDRYGGFWILTCT